MVEKPNRWKWGSSFILAWGAVLYLLSLSRSYVGFYYDDADYILTAMALIRGRFTSLRLPGQFVLHSHWPGFSMVLAPWIPLVQPHWALLKMIPLSCVLLSAFLTARWWRNRFSVDGTLALTALFAWNPSTIDRAGAVMSEPLFLLLVLVAVTLLEFRTAGITRGWKLGLIAAAAAFVRPEGILLTASLTIALYLWSDGIEALICGIPTLALAAFYFLLRFFGRLPFPGYWNDWLRNAPGFSISAWIHQASVQCLTMFAGIFFNLPVPRFRIMFIAGMLLTLMAMGAVGIGVRKLWGDHARRVQTGALILFSSSYFVFHIFWPVVDRRFLWLLLPIFLYFGWTALEPRDRRSIKDSNLKQKRPGQMKALTAVLAVLLTSYGWTAFRSIHSSEAEASTTRFPRASLEWISAHLGEKDRVLTNNPSMVYLYTGRSAIGLQADELSDAAMFFYGCTVSHVTTLVYFSPPPDFANLPETDTLLGRWERSRSWADARLYAFQKPAAYSPEGVAIYQVKLSHAYPQAYRLYVSAMMDFSRNNMVWGRAKLTEALREDPEFPEAQTAYALCLLATGGPAREAEDSLKQSLRLDPTYAPTLAALLRIEQTK